jgi:DegV family protein with EDD domain
VIDSLTTSIGLGWLIEAAAEAAANGAALDEIVRIVRGMITHMYAVFFVDQLDYLERNGRLSKSQAVLGTMLGIKPFLTIEEGEIIPMEKVRTRDKAIDNWNLCRNSRPSTVSRSCRAASSLLRIHACCWSAWNRHFPASIFRY